MRLRDAIMELAPRCDDADVVVQANPLERTEQSVAMRCECDIAAPVPGKRRVGKMANRIPQCLVIVALGHRGRKPEPGNVHTPDDLADCRAAS